MEEQEGRSVKREGSNGDEGQCVGWISAAHPPFSLLMQVDALRLSTLPTYSFSIPTVPTNATCLSPFSIHPHPQARLVFPQSAARFWTIPHSTR